MTVASTTAPCLINTPFSSRYRFTFLKIVSARFFSSKRAHRWYVDQLFLHSLVAEGMLEQVNGQQHPQRLSVLPHCSVLLAIKGLEQLLRILPWRHHLHR